MELYDGWGVAFVGVLGCSEHECVREVWANRKKQPEGGFGVLRTKDALASGSRGYV